jgi:hypothetical protein
VDRPRDQFFASACLAIQQDGRIRPGDPQDLLEELQKWTAFSHETHMMQTGLYLVHLGESGISGPL